MEQHTDAIRSPGGWQPDWVTRLPLRWLLGPVQETWHVWTCISTLDRLLRLSLLCWRQKGPSCIAASVPFAKRADAFADSLQQAPPPFCHPEDYLAAVSARGAGGDGFTAQAYHNFPRVLAAVSKETEYGLGTNRLPALPPADYRETR